MGRTVEREVLDRVAVEWRAAARPADGFYSSFVLRRVSWRVTRLLARRGVSPDQVTVATLALGLLAAAGVASGHRAATLVAAVALQLCMVGDCVDGELARSTRRFSASGAWLDAMSDRVREIAVLLALGVWAAREGRSGWALVGAVIALQAFRHVSHLAWSRQRATSGRVVAAQTSPGALGWLRRIGHLPIGERFVLLSIGIAAGDPHGTLIVLLVAGSLATGYLLAAVAVRAEQPSALAPAFVVGVGLGFVLAIGGDSPLSAFVVAAAALLQYQHAYRRIP